MKPWVALPSSNARGRGGECQIQMSTSDAVIVVGIIMTVILWHRSHQILRVFFCDSLYPCYDPCHVIKHES